MPNKLSAAKALRQSTKRAAKNLAVRSDIRTKIKQIRKMIASKDKAVETELKTLQQMLGKAAKRNTFHSNTASRKLSRLYAQYRTATAKK